MGAQRQSDSVCGAAAWCSTVVLSATVDAGGFLVELHALGLVLVVEGAAAGRAARGRVDDDPTGLEGARLALDDLVADDGLLAGRTARGNGVGPVVADDGGLHSGSLVGAALHAQTVFDGQEETTDGAAVARHLDQRGLAGLAVDDGVGLAVLAVDVVGDVESVLMTALAERTVFLVDLQRVDALVAVACVTLKGVDHVFLVGLEVAHGHDRLDDGLDGGGHGGRATDGVSSTGGGLSRREEELPYGRGRPEQTW